MDAQPLFPASGDGLSEGVLAAPLRQHLGGIEREAAAGHIHVDIGDAVACEQLGRARPVAGVEPLPRMVPHPADLPGARPIGQPIGAVDQVPQVGHRLIGPGGVLIQPSLDGLLLPGDQLPDGGQLPLPRGGLLAVVQILGRRLAEAVGQAVELRERLRVEVLGGGAPSAGGGLGSHRQEEQLLPALVAVAGENMGHPIGVCAHAPPGHLRALPGAVAPPGHRPDPALLRAYRKEVRAGLQDFHRCALGPLLAQRHPAPIAAVAAHIAAQRQPKEVRQRLGGRVADRKARPPLQLRTHGGKDALGRRVAINHHGQAQIPLRAQLPIGYQRCLNPRFGIPALDVPGERLGIPSLALWHRQLGIDHRHCGRAQHQGKEQRTEEQQPAQDLDLVAEDDPPLGQVVGRNLQRHLIAGGNLD